jgi:chromosome segregation ATPase
MEKEDIENSATSSGRLEDAKRAMESSEQTSQRELAEKQTSIKSKRDDLLLRLSNVKQAKERLELSWIGLDDKRKILRQELAPLLVEEKDAESSEVKLEEEESHLPPSLGQQVVEKKRQAVAAKRSDIEAKKWVIEDRVASLEEKIKQLTAEYQKLLDEEIKLTNELDALKQQVETDIQ